MAFLNLALKLVSYDDDASNNSPDLGTANRSFVAQGVEMGEPLAYPLRLAAGETQTVFDGSRTLGFDNSTQLALSISPLAPSRYRLKWTGTGTNPAFRTERSFGANGSVLTLAVNTNQTVTVTGAGPTYSAAQAGDQVLIPGVSTGDSASVFNPLNEGYWVVLAATGSSFTMSRIPGDSAVSAAGEVVTVTAVDQFIVMAPDRVQAGDQVEISAGFSSNSRRVYQVLAAAPKWVDFQSSVALAAETATPGTGGIAAYSMARAMLWTEADQLLLLAVNGDASATHKIDPLTLPDGRRLAVDFRIGPVWKLLVTNKASVPAKGLVLAYPAA